MTRRWADAAGIAGGVATILVSGSHLRALAFAFSFLARTGDLPLHHSHPFIASPLTLTRIGLWLVIAALVLGNQRRLAVIAAAVAVAGELVVASAALGDGWTGSGSIELALSVVVLTLMMIGLAGEVGFQAVNGVGRACVIVAAVAVAMGSSLPVLASRGKPLAIAESTTDALILGTRCLAAAAIGVATWLAYRRLAGQRPAAN